MKILVVEDDAALLRALTTGFQQRGYEVAEATTFQDAWLRIAMGTFSILVLDVMLPGGTGIELCKKVRQRGIVTPILMLTARDAIEDRVYGLEAGADDYLVKPFAFEELVARVHALSRRPPVIAPAVEEYLDLAVDLNARAVRRAGQEIELTAKEFSLLELFLQKRGKVVDRAMIISHVWDENYDPASNTVEVLVRRLREKIDDPFEPRLIHTLRGVGYKFGA
jgi:two-component system, OmpR family, copper resistance phosphate regulon response regulator CusR